MHTRGLVQEIPMVESGSTDYAIVPFVPPILYSLLSLTCLSCPILTREVCGVGSGITTISDCKTCPRLLPHRSARPRVKWRSSDQAYFLTAFCVAARALAKSSGTRTGRGSTLALNGRNDG